jgi:cyanophycinase-like exopeptidase
VTGPLALHGGGEFESGDELVLIDLLQIAIRRPDREGPIRIAMVPTATADWDPARSAAHGAAALERAATSVGIETAIDAVLIVDAASASDEGNARLLRGADLIYLPGGDPRRIMTTLSDTLALEAIRTAHASGATLAGASAGAMSLASWSWAPKGGVEGFGIVRGILVVPHADEARWPDEVRRSTEHVPAGFGVLGLAERTAAITNDPQAPTIQWRIVGTGDARWVARPGAETIVAHAGALLETP